jgi:hypothetical protein
VRRIPQHRSILAVVSATSAHLFQTFRHQRNVCQPIANRFTRQTLLIVNRNNFFMSILCIKSYCLKNLTRERCSSVVYILKTSPFWLLKLASEHAHARLLPRLSWSWTMLLPSDTYRNPVTSIIADIHQFMTYSLTLAYASTVLDGYGP